MVNVLGSTSSSDLSFCSCLCPKPCDRKRIGYPGQNSQSATLKIQFVHLHFFNTIFWSLRLNEPRGLVNVLGSTSSLNPKFNLCFCPRFSDFMGKRLDIRDRTHNLRPYKFKFLHFEEKKCFTFLGVNVCVFSILSVEPKRKLLVHEFFFTLPTLHTFCHGRSRQTKLRFLDN